MLSIEGQHSANIRGWQNLFFNGAQLVLFSIRLALQEQNSLGTSGRTYPFSAASESHCSSFFFFSFAFFFGIFSCLPSSIHSVSRTNIVANERYYLVCTSSQGWSEVSVLARRKPLLYKILSICKLREKKNIRTCSHNRFRSTQVICIQMLSDKYSEQKNKNVNILKRQEG